MESSSGMVDGGSQLSNSLSDRAINGPGDRSDRQKADADGLDDRSQDSCGSDGETKPLNHANITMTTDAGLDDEEKAS